MAENQPTTNGRSADPLSALKNTLSELSKEKEAQFLVRETVNKKLQEVYSLIRAHKEKRDQTIALIRDEKQKRGELHSQIQTFGAAPPKQVNRRSSGLSLRDLSSKIATMERTFEMSVMSPDKEREFMKKLKALKAEYEQGKKEQEARNVQREALQKKHDLRMTAQEIHDHIQAVAKENQEAHKELLAQYNLMKELREEQVTLTAQIDEKREKIVSLRKELDALFTQKRAERAVRDEHQKKSDDSRRRDEMAALRQKSVEVEAKMKRGEKLTTEDLIAFQRGGE